VGVGGGMCDREGDRREWNECEGGGSGWLGGGFRRKRGKCSQRRGLGGWDVRVWGLGRIEWEGTGGVATLGVCCGGRVGVVVEVGEDEGRGWRSPIYP
jgi:hypothetical protein